MQTKGWDRHSREAYHICAARHKVEADALQLLLQRAAGNNVADALLRMLWVA